MHVDISVVVCSVDVVGSVVVVVVVVVVIVVVGANVAVVVVRSVVVVVGFVKVVAHPISSHRRVIQSCHVQGRILIYLATTGVVNTLMTGELLSVFPGNTWI